MIKKIWKENRRKLVVSIMALLFCFVLIVGVVTYYLLGQNQQEEENTHRSGVGGNQAKSGR